MLILFKENLLERITADRAFTGGYSSTVVSAYRGRIQLLRAAPQEEALRELRSLRMERCGNGAHSMRVTDAWELILGFEDSEDGRVAVVEAMVERTGKEHNEG